MDGDLFGDHVALVAQLFDFGQDGHALFVGMGKGAQSMAAPRVSKRLLERPRNFVGQT
jgi:hypothetical protein